MKSLQESILDDVSKQIKNLDEVVSIESLFDSNWKEQIELLAGFIRSDSKNKQVNTTRSIGSLKPGIYIKILIGNVLEPPKYWSLTIIDTRDADVTNHTNGFRISGFERDVKKPYKIILGISPISKWISQGQISQGQNEFYLAFKLNDENYWGNFISDAVEYIKTHKLSHI